MCDSIWFVEKKDGKVISNKEVDQIDGKCLCGKTKQEIMEYIVKSVDLGWEEQITIARNYTYWVVIKDDINKNQLL